LLQLTTLLITRDIQTTTSNRHETDQQKSFPTAIDRQCFPLVFYQNSLLLAQQHFPRGLKLFVGELYIVIHRQLPSSIPKRRPCTSHTFNECGSGRGGRSDGGGLDAGAADSIRFDPGDACRAPWFTHKSLQYGTKRAIVNRSRSCTSGSCQNEKLLVSPLHERFAFAGLTFSMTF